MNTKGRETYQEAFKIMNANHLAMQDLLYHESDRQHARAQAFLNATFITENKVKELQTYLDRKMEFCRDAVALKEYIQGSLDTLNCFMDCGINDMFKEEPFKLVIETETDTETNTERRVCKIIQ